MIIGMAITSAVTFGIAYLFMYLYRKHHWYDKVANWTAKRLLWIRIRTPWYRIMKTGFSLKVGSFELEIHPRDNRPKLYIQRYGKRD